MNRIEASICFSTEILIMPSKVGLETNIFGNGTLQFWLDRTSCLRGPSLELDHFDRNFSNEISEYFDIRKAPPPPPTRTITQCLRQRSISYVFHHCVLTTKRSSYFAESMKSPEIKRREVIATCVANVFSFLLARHLMTNARYPTSCSSWL